MYIDNIIRLLEQKPYLKTHLINFNKRFEDKAKNSCFNHDTAIKQYNNFYKLMQEKCYVLTCFAILEEALKDLKINDFMLLYDVYFYKKHFKTIIESLGINQRTYFRRLQIAKANLLKNVKYHDKKGYIENIDQVKLKFFPIFKYKINRPVNIYTPLTNTQHDLNIYVNYKNEKCVNDGYFNS